jgi:hypothetical protein
MADDDVAGATKVCSRCGVAKQATSDNFYWEKQRNRASRPLAALCKTCVAAHSKAHYQANSALINERQQKARIPKLAIRNATARQWRADNPEEARRKDAATYRAISPEAKKLRLEQQRLSRHKRIPGRKTRVYRPCRITDRPAWLIQQHAYYQENREAIRATILARMNARPTLRLNARMSARLNRCLRACGGKQGVAWVKLVGYTHQALATHLERQFAKGMSWANMGQWHIDHIQPLASFSYSCASDPEFLAAWALSNLRPLWATENVTKHATRTLLL